MDSKKLQQARQKERDLRMVARIDDVGFIEKADGSGTSFNVFSYSGARRRPLFYKCAYSIIEARRLLRELEL